MSMTRPTQIRGRTPHALSLVALVFAITWHGMGCLAGTPVSVRAEAYMAEAQGMEPQVTPVLERLASEHAGRMYKLEHRLKRRGSLIRKINKILTEKPGMRLEEVRINDALRYTILVADQPPGHHLNAVTRVLSTLEDLGQRVITVKNYWPRGDNYSGINSVLKAPGGLTWELQFHTEASVETNGKTREMYEELRLTTTPIHRKRTLFDAMSALWEEVTIPEGLLVEYALHPTERIILRPRP